MASNEGRARLVGWEPTANGWVYVDKDGFYPCPAYDTSLDAVAELLRFVRERGKEIKFVYALDSIVRPNTRFNLIAATPQQLCAAFDAVFKDELEKIQYRRRERTSPHPREGAMKGRGKMASTVNSDPHYITALVTKYYEREHEVEIQRSDGTIERFDPYVCGVIPHTQTTALVGHYVKIIEPFYSMDGCMLCSAMNVIEKEGA